MIYQLVNLGMHLLHLGVISFSLLGWASPVLRPWHLVLQGGILLSWLGYGMLDGRWGRCAITDLHWYWKERWGKRPATESYIDYWLRLKWHLAINPQVSESGTFSIFAVITFLSLSLCC